MKKEFFLKAAIVVFAGIFIFSSYNIAVELIEYSKAKKLYSSLQEEYTKPVTPQSVNTENQEVKEPAIRVDFTALLNKNSEAVGWIYLPDTIINYPVVKASDNDKYLKRDFSGNTRSSGAIFADCRNGEFGQDTNYIIYGHHMKNGTMFSTIVKYKKQKFYDEHPVVYYFTPEKTYKIELVAGRVVPGDAEIYNKDLSKTEVLDLINDYYIKHSTFKSGVSVNEEDVLITLSTCTYEYDNARYVIIGKLVEE